MPVAPKHALNRSTGLRVLFTSLRLRIPDSAPAHRTSFIADRGLNVHPGIVVGQLQRRLGRYDLFRKYQVKVRQFVTSSALTDGWGVVHTA